MTFEALPPFLFGVGAGLGLAGLYILAQLLFVFRR